MLTCVLERINLAHGDTYVQASFTHCLYVVGKSGIFPFVTC
jgi:hypothetical protein